MACNRIFPIPSTVVEKAGKLTTMPFRKEVKWLRKRRKTQEKSLRKEENTMEKGFHCPSPMARVLASAKSLDCINRVKHFKGC